jgi:methionyl-tRNA formyltransferase
MAFVLQFAPQEFVTLPKHGTLQFHPSLLPKYRGPSSINWPISRGDRETGLTLFRPTDGLDEGAVILQKRTPVGDNDTLGNVYFERLFPMGVQALLEAADLVVAGKHRESAQDESQASYEGWFREAEAKIHWANHVDAIHNLIRASDPAPGAWTTLGGAKVQLFDSRKEIVRTFGAVKGKIGEVLGLEDGRLVIAAQGGRIHAGKAKLGDGKKIAAAELVSSGAIQAGQILAS